MPDELQVRPGDRLLELLDERGLTLTDFALLLYPHRDARHTVSNLRKYTHAETRKWPRPETVGVWARALEVDPETFFQK
jgi:hypothetical protein